MAKPTKEEMEKSPEVAKLRAALQELGVILRDPRHPLSDYPPYHLKQVIEGLLGDASFGLVRGSYSPHQARLWLKDSRGLTEYQAARIVGALADEAEARGMLTRCERGDSFGFAAGLMFGLTRLEELNVRKMLLIAAIEEVPVEGFDALDALFRVVVSMDADIWGDCSERISEYLRIPTRETACDSISHALYNYRRGTCLEDLVSDLIEWADSFAGSRASVEHEEWYRAAKTGRLPYRVESFDELEELGFDAERWREGGYAREYE